MAELDVVVVGSCNMDLISYVSRLPKPGETIHGNKFSLGFGGKGANQCVMAARLGAATAMVAKVGDDVFGSNFIQNFKDNGVNVDNVEVTKEASTGVAPIAVNEDGQNSIIIVSGANLKLTAADVKEHESVITQAKVLICQLEIQPETSLEALRIGKQHGVTTILNPAPAEASLDPELYKLSDIFCPNETEAEILTGLPVTTAEEAEKAADVLLDKGCEKVIITLGEKGCLCKSSVSEKGIHVPARKVSPVDTTGAGDAFVGSLAYYMACHKDLRLEEVIQKACHISSISVCSPGTQTSFPYRKDLPKDLF
ncbi:PREDICTED: ribokinase-like isoform X1 [Branchiostoma belcheri]|uniref:Ribokinase n=2 Tax=Branchiostoma belcheri TaxID=7741 RepID=A0A6P4Y2K3_BRABE|nr:PREDICTED: ribokinase-like isoform X1 [Branchiostoma belcheri]